MTPQELFDAFQTVCHSDRPVEAFEIPVEVNGNEGMFNPAAVADALVTQGEITSETIFGVSIRTDDDQWEDDWAELSKIEITGPPQLF